MLHDSHFGIVCNENNRILLIKNLIFRADPAGYEIAKTALTAPCVFVTVLR